MIPLGLVHHEAQRDHRDGADLLARVRRPAPVRAGRATPRATVDADRARWRRWLAEVTGYAAGVDPAERRQPGRARRAAGHPRLPRRAAATIDRRVCLIPSSAHGTNAASAVMAGMKVVVVKAGRGRLVDLDDLRAKIADAPRPAGRDHGHLPLDPRRVRGGHRRAVRDWCTTPAARSTSTAPTSTRCSAWPSPGEFGADVSHLNLHKTFCIPHGGGGPGVGPVGGAGAPGAVPAQPPAARRGRARDAASGRSRPPRTARPASCRSAGPTSR